MRVQIKSEVTGALVLLICVGCAGIPPGPNTDADSVEKHCNRELRGIYDFGAVGNAVVTAVFTIGELGTNVVGYEVCKDTMTLHPAPGSSVRDGVYQSYAQSFMVAIPERLKQDPQNPSGIWQSFGENPDMAIFPAADPAGRIYFASGSSKLYEQDASLSPQEFESRIFTKNGQQFLDARGVSLQRLYEEDINLNGEPAVFVVYEEDSKATVTADSTVSPSPSSPIFLLYWVIKTSKHAARLTVAWPGSCPKCASGPEAEIRTMDPGIAKFVNSFRLTDSRETH